MIATHAWSSQMAARVCNIVARPVDNQFAQPAELRIYTCIDQQINRGTEPNRGGLAAEVSVWWEKPQPGTHSDSDVLKLSIGCKTRVPFSSSFLLLAYHASFFAVRMMATIAREWVLPRQFSSLLQSQLPRFGLRLAAYTEIKVWESVNIE